METATQMQKDGYISVKELKPFIVQTVSEVLSDPDFGLELSNEAQERLRKARNSSERGISLSEVKQGRY